MWHCAGGKDRAGFGSIVILAILGVSKEDILEDYLMTNFYNHEDISRMREKAENAQLPADIKREDFVRTMLQFCDANEKYFDQIFMAADELYGGFDQYIRDGLHISAQHIEELRDRYLI